MITITSYDTLPNYADINIRAISVSLRDRITDQVLNTLNSQIKQVSIRDVMTMINAPVNPNDREPISILKFLEILTFNDGQDKSNTILDKGTDELLK